MALKLSKAALRATTVGQMVNLLSNDVQKFNKAGLELPYLIIGPMQTIIITYILWAHIGYASLAGVSLLLLYTPLQGFMGELFSKIGMQTAILTDRRIHLMNEIIGAMRVIKMYGWEIPFAQQVDFCRRKELLKIRLLAILRGINYAVFDVSSKIILLVSFLVFLLSVEGDLTAEKVFVCMVLINALRITMTYLFPAGVVQISSSKISLKRIENFLLLEEKLESSVPDVADFGSKPQECGVWINNAKASWNKDGETTLKNVTLTIKPGELLTIVGPVGSGKTSLLMSILGELPILSGDVKVQGKVAYVPQESWMFGGSVKQNILFGNEFEKSKYKKVISVCALERDFELFPSADETAVGERGFSLSGGQKARINFARALYFGGDIFLLDDPLSAVDSSVSRHLFEKCINDYLKHKVRILVTHQIQYLKFASQILLMKEGSCLFWGTYEQLLGSGLDLGFLMKEHEKDKPENMDVAYNGTPFESKTTDPSFPFGYKSEVKTNRQAFEKAPEIEEESKYIGAVNKNVYKEYIKAGAGAFHTFILILSFIATQVLWNGNDFWLIEWTNLEHRQFDIKNCWGNINETSLNHTFSFNDTYDQDNFREIAGTSTIDCLTLIENYQKNGLDAKNDVNRSFYLVVYVGFVLAVFLLALFRSTLFFHLCMKASIKLHDNMFQSVLRFPIEFFDSNPVGRVLNRFSKDVGIMDDIMPITAMESIGVIIIVVGIMCAEAIVEPWLLISTTVICILFYLIRRIYVPTARDINRYEAITRSPVFSHLSTTLFGLTTIRAFKAQKSSAASFDHYQDQHTATWFMLICSNRWFGTMLDWLCAAYLTCVTVAMVVISKEGSYASKAGLAITYAIHLAGNFQLAMRQSVDVENQMVSTERILEYCKLKREAALESSKDNQPPQNWPYKGHIVYKDVTLKYAKNDRPVLNNINFEIFPEEKIGIVGRTGAGKSSLLATLLRMSEPEGTITIDGVGIKDIGLHDLRKGISIIPQDPMLFSGPIRKNLDPFNEHNDDELWQALEKTCLKKAIEGSPGGMDTEVAEGGANFSVGQRQLICLARAILRRNKILVLDEATANVDQNTDRLIQQAIKICFEDCTILTIAHRLHTVMDSDRVMVLDAGEIKEFDNPYTLLQNPNGIFSHMVQMTGPGMARRLQDLSRSVHMKKISSKVGVTTSVLEGDGVIKMHGTYVEQCVDDSIENNASKFIESKQL